MRSRKKKIKKSCHKRGGLNNYQLKIEYSKTESEVEAKEVARSDLEAKLASPGTFADPVTGKQLLADYERVQTELKKLYTHWEELASEMTERDLS